MASKPNHPADKKPPAFFIPASYKGNQVVPPISAKASLTVGIAESGQQLGNNVGLSSRVGTPLGTIGKVASTDSARSIPGKPGSYLLASPSGVLDLSLYNYVPVTEKSAGKHNGQSNSHGLANQDQPDGITHESKLTPTDGAETAVVEKEKKRRRFRRPRRNSKLDRLIRILEDKRVGDDEDGEELEDLQLPRLRRVLNIIFVTLGVCFLLAVITVILYTTIATAYMTVKINNHLFNKGNMPSRFKFKDYCPVVSKAVRARFGVNKLDYWDALTGHQPLWDSSRGKSGSKFLVTYNRQFAAKTIIPASFTFFCPLQTPDSIWMD
ncbi:hypothetical protein X801_01155 [Opisthorchis viverrini]|uniref:Uncharacterized protein n=2 Tax=Opisthorchis viverrini TaxID=6198 RepID=A0A1S8X8C3_OPIVI|nr:hypothetical protein T265_07997 [Opisthorchis viverrini]KER24311.1 hypothetical protein T265_07997 [Opisthorchis viverrini]OON22938.1 hypothetical protein X801_01155 [Opisthorchis viverrini]